LILTTTPDLPGKKIVRTLGLVRGSTVRAKHIGKDILALFRNIVGGEINEYTKKLAESREQALDRMIHDAEKLGANAIIGVHFASSSIASGAAEILVYGTAVVVEE
jgi:uncharacterized protein YbjQ (UPF0145 family)